MVETDHGPSSLVSDHLTAKQPVTTFDAMAPTSWQAPTHPPLFDPI